MLRMVPLPRTSGEGTKGALRRDRAEAQADVIGDPGAGLVDEDRAQQIDYLLARGDAVARWKRREEIVAERLKPGVEAAFDHGRSRDEINLLDPETGRFELPAIGGGRGEIPWAERAPVYPAACQHGVERYLDRGGVVVAAHLGDEPATRLQRPAHAGQHRLGRAHPMQRRIREHGIELVLESEALPRHDPR